MANDPAMLISEFASRSRLPIDTIRFYIRKGLLKPSTSEKGGTRPYQMFHARHLDVVETIRIGQSLGLSLDEIAALVEERRLGQFTKERSVRFLRDRREILSDRYKHLGRLVAFLDAKIAWLNDARGAKPRIESFLYELE